MMTFTIRAVAFGALLLAIPAQAQNSFPTATGSRVNGAAIMCVASDGNAKPCDTTTPVPVTVQSGGGNQAVTIADGANVTQGTTTDSACSTDNGTCTIEALIKRLNQRLTTLNTTLGTPAQATGATVTPTSQYPSGAIPITASATGTTGATTATLAAHATKTTYLCGFSIRATATAAAVGNATVTGTVTATLNFTQWTGAAASAIGITEPNIGSVCIPGSAANTAIAVVSAAPGTGGVVSVSAWGYQL